MAMKARIWNRWVTTMSRKAPVASRSRPVVDRQRLGYVDLHVVDVVPVPDRLEQPVGEAEGQDVLRRLLPQEVVDAEHLLLGEDLVHRGVELSGAGQVGAERLLHDDPGPLDQPGLGQQRITSRAAAGGTLK